MCLILGRFSFAEKKGRFLLVFAIWSKCRKNGANHIVMQFYPFAEKMGQISLEYAIWSKCRKNGANLILHSNWYKCRKIGANLIVICILIHLQKKWGKSHYYMEIDPNAEKMGQISLEYAILSKCRKKGQISLV